MKCVQCGETVSKRSTSCEKCGFSTSNGLVPVRNKQQNNSQATVQQRPMLQTSQMELYVPRPAERHRPGSAKFAISIDKTGSTQAFQVGVPFITEKALRALEAVIKNIDIDLWTHGDLDYGQEPVQLVQSGNVDQTLEAIGTITYDGGGDLPESHADQAENVLTVTPWGTKSMFCRDVALMFLTDDTKTPRSCKSMTQLGTEYKHKGVKLILVCQETNALRELVDAAGGYLIAISNNPDEAEIQKVVSTLTATLTITVSGSGNTITMNPVKA